MALERRKTLQLRVHRAQIENQSLDSLPQFAAAKQSWIVHTEPFWRLREGGESRKLDAGQEYI
jgi:hypothetical protein